MNEKTVTKEKIREHKEEYKAFVRREHRLYKARIRLAKSRYLRATSSLGQTKMDPPKRSVLEEIGNSVTHGLGSVFAIIAPS